VLASIRDQGGDSVGDHLSAFNQAYFRSTPDDQYQRVGLECGGLVHGAEVVL
jgi:hypothetical protein